MSLAVAHIGRCYAMLMFFAVAHMVAATDC